MTKIKLINNTFFKELKIGNVYILIGNKLFDGHKYIGEVSAEDVITNFQLVK